MIRNSLAVPCRSYMPLWHLSNFLRITHRPFSIVLGGDLLDPSTDPTGYLRDGKDLEQGGSLLKVGFNFQTQGPYGPWMNTLLSWAAIRIGRRRRIPDLGITQPVPYILYNGRPVPVLTKGMIKAWSRAEQANAYKQGWVVDGWGYKKPKDLANEDLLVLHVAVKKEIRRLDKIWRAQP